jgi:hypothetical protein
MWKTRRASGAHPSLAGAHRHRKRPSVGVTLESDTARHLRAICAPSFPHPQKTAKSNAAVALK